jgi:regulatory protein
MRRPRRVPPDDAPPPDPYSLGSRLLGRRDLSVTELRARLLASGSPPEAVDTAVARLVERGAADDRRVAEAYARTAASIRGRGRDRIRRELESRGIAREVVREALDAALPPEDEDARIDRAIARRHPGAVDDDRQGRRLYQWLVRQGYEPERVRLALERRRRGPRDDGD